MDFGALIPDIAKAIHVAPSTLVFVILCVTTLSRVLARRIPANATGFWGFMRQTFAIFGAEVANRLTPDATVVDVAKAALVTPPIDEKVADGVEPAPEP